MLVITAAPCNVARKNRHRSFKSFSVKSPRDMMRAAACNSLVMALRKIVEYFHTRRYILREFNQRIDLSSTIRVSRLKPRATFVKANGKDIAITQIAVLKRSLAIFRSLSLFLHYSYVIHNSLPIFLSMNTYLV